MPTREKLTMRALILLTALALVIAAVPTAAAEDLWPSDTPLGPDPEPCRPSCLNALPLNLEDGPGDSQPCRPSC